MKYQNTWGTTVMVDKVVKQRKEDYVVGHTETGARVYMKKTEFERRFKPYLESL